MFLQVGFFKAQGSSRRVLHLLLFLIGPCATFCTNGHTETGAQYGGNVSSLEPRAISVSTNGLSVPLDSEFRRTSDGSQSLTYQIVSVQDPSGILSQSQLAGGALNLTAAAGRSGEATVTVKASFAKHFPVFDNIALWTGDGSKPRWDALTKQNSEVRAAGLENRVLLTHDFFFNCIDSENCDVSQLELGGDGKTYGLVDILNQHVPPDEPIVLDIENEANYSSSNLPGIRRLWEALNVVRQIREAQRSALGLSGVGSIGYYRMVPDRWWWGAVPFARLQRDRRMNLNSYYVRSAEIEAEANIIPDSFTADNQAWQARNQRLRQESPWPGAPPLASGVSDIYPSLYTLYRGKDWQYGAYLEVTYDQVSNQFKTSRCGFQDGNIIQLVQRKPFDSARPVPSSLLDPVIPPELRPYTNYYVHNPNNDSEFQLKLNATDVSPIRFSSAFKTGPNGSANFVYMMRVNKGHTLCQDMDVVDWPLYAEEHIKEARKFGKAVYAYLSPTYKGVEGEYVEPEFWRQQLEVVRQLADGVVIFDKTVESPATRQSHGWWKETVEFMQSLYPRTKTFRVSVSGTVTSASIVAGDVNNDQKVTGEDFLLCLGNPRLVGCDVNNDGVTGWSDQFLILEKLNLPLMLGDFDRDGRITAGDEDACRRFVGQQVSSSNYLCDLNRSASISEKDIELINEIYTSSGHMMGRILGDVNSSGYVDSGDLVIVLANYMHPLGRRAQFSDGDMDGDSDVDAADVATVVAMSYRVVGGS